MTVEELKKELDKYPKDAIVIVPIDDMGKGSPTYLFYDEKENELHIDFT